jgi:hypothetical protein
VIGPGSERQAEPRPPRAHPAPIVLSTIAYVSENQLMAAPRQRRVRHSSDPGRQRDEDRNSTQRTPQQHNVQDSNERETQQHEAQVATQRAKRFARDVGINVLANLIAAGIIYLAAVAAGYLKANPALFIVATFTSTVVLLSVMLILSGSTRYITSGGDSGHVSRAKNRIIYAATLIFAFGILAIGYLVGAWFRSTSSAYAQIFAVESYLTFLVGIVGIRIAKRKTRNPVSGWVFWPILIALSIIGVGAGSGYILGLPVS